MAGWRPLCEQWRLLPSRPRTQAQLWRPGIGSGGPEVWQHLRRSGGGVKLVSPLPPVSGAAPTSGFLLWELKVCFGDDDYLLAHLRAAPSLPPWSLCTCTGVSHNLNFYNLFTYVGFFLQLRKALNIV